MPDSLIIVDPIFRGSRLYFTRLAVKAAESLGITCSIVTRTAARTDQFDELFAGTEVPIYEVARVDEDFWYGKISEHEQNRLIAKVSELVGDRFDQAIYFPGLNELWPEIAPILMQSDLAKLPTLTVEYHPEYFLRASASISASTIRGKWRQWQRWRKVRSDRFEVLIPWLNANQRTLVLSLDERVLNPEFSRVPRGIRSKIGYLSDPAPIRVSSGGPIPNLAEKTNLLLVGSQSARKGLFNIIRLCNQYPINDLGVRFTLIGKLTAETEFLRPQLKKHASLISWTDGYVSEQEIASAYERADYVVLPYTRDFSGSSGVLGSAVAHKKPVIASDHGLVGYRVSTHGLGILFPVQSLEQLWTRLRTLPDPKSDGTYKQWVANIEKYAPLISEKNHVNQLVEFLQKTI